MRLARSIFVAVIFALLAGAPPPAAAQGKTYRLAVFSISVVSVENTRTMTLPMLEKFGFVAGRNLEIVSRVGSPDRMPALMREILAAKPDVILAVGGEAIQAARTATASVPIVIFGPDPVQLGVTENISRPGGNVTGILILATQLDAKRLTLLHEAVPPGRRLAALINPTSPNREPSERLMRAAAAAAGIDLSLFYAAGPSSYGTAFAAMRNAGIGGVAITANPEYFRDTAEILRLAHQARLATVCQWNEMAAAGCMLSYGPNLTRMRERAAYYIARIFEGVKPSDLPIEQPSQVEMAVNLTTARLLGIAVPQSLLVRAEHVIE
jgi:putative ABC transport system substrate-binding protein